MPQFLSDPNERRVERPCGDGIVAALSYYPSAAAHGAHHHDYHQLSLLLAGSMRERLDGRTYDLDRLAIGIKPPGADHDDQWGRHGVLIFSLKVDAGLQLPDLADPRWQFSRDESTIAALVHTCLLHHDGRSRLEAAKDLLSIPSTVRPDDRTLQPSMWLERVREEICDDPNGQSIEALARGAGVDRAHLARSFRRAYGMPPSVYRQRRLTARAIGLIVGEETPLSHIASDAGFFDQPHLSRQIRGRTGLSPGKLRSLLGRANHIRPRPA